jgi:uncharacterized membrane protein YhaH (DUF805 family)
VFAYLEPLWRPLVRYADFKGRSTRTDLGVFWALLMVLSLPLHAAEIIGVLSVETRRVVESVLVLLILCPLVALLVRRLHDQGRGGWWLLIGAPALSLILVQQWRRLTLGWDIVGGRDPFPVDLVAGISILVVAVLVLLPNEPGPNRFGPDPRRSRSGGTSSVSG